MAKAHRGDPSIDSHVLSQTRGLVSLLKKSMRNLDTKTLYDVSSLLHEGLAKTELFKGVRTTQPTTRVGGRKAKRQKSA